MPIRGSTYIFPNTIIKTKRGIHVVSRIYGWIFYFTKAATNRFGFQKCGALLYVPVSKHSWSNFWQILHRRCFVCTRKWCSVYCYNVYFGVYRLDQAFISTISFTHFAISFTGSSFLSISTVCVPSEIICSALAMKHTSQRWYTFFSYKFAFIGQHGWSWVWVCWNRGIGHHTLLTEILSKVFSKIINKKLTDTLDEHIWRERAGFRAPPFLLYHVW